MSPRRPDATVAAILAEAKTIRAALRAVGVPASDLPDLEQEVVMRAWLQLRASGDDGLLASLLWTIAWRTGRGWLKSRSTRERRTTEPIEDVEIAGPDLLRRLEARAKLRVLARLDPRERRIVQALAEGTTTAELADQLRVPPGTASTWIRRMRREQRRK